MSFDGAEISTQDSSDIRLYEFILGGAIWRYCTGEREVKVGNIIYPPAPISDAGLKQKGTAVTDDFIVTMPTIYPIPQLFRGTVPSQTIRLVVRQTQIETPDDAPVMWLGYVSSVKIKDEVISDVLCNSQTAFLRRKGLRTRYTRECPHALYDSECSVDKTLWAEPVTVGALTGVSFNYDYVNAPLSAARNGRFINGFIEWEPTFKGNPVGYTERRGILAHDEATRAILLLGQTDGLSPGLVVTLYPGCQRNPGNCQLFHNIPNYGGYAFMPGVSPFDGNPVF